MKYLAIQRVCLTVAGCFLANAIAIDSSSSLPQLSVTLGTEAQARSSGGRSGGGSFRSNPSSPSRPSTPSYSNPSYSNPSYSNPSYSNPGSGGSYPSNPYRDNRGGGTVIVPVPVGPPSYTNPAYGGTTTDGSSNIAVFILGLLLMGGAGFALLLGYLAIKAKSGDRSGFGAASVDKELDNNIVTVSKIQVALLAQAREIQTDLTQFSLEVDTDTQAGLYQLMQESILALLRSPENWSHVLASSQTVKNREAAEALFNQISVAERSKFSLETLSNVGGKVYRRDFKPDPEEDPAAYIVVTLVAGTAHDQPLFDKIQTESALKESLQKLAAIPLDYLMVFELLWSPQDAQDSLTYEELLTEYTDMAQI
jgi:uncharacterized membrane protein